MIDEPSKASIMLGRIREMLAQAGYPEGFIDDCVKQCIVDRDAWHKDCKKAEKALAHESARAEKAEKEADLRVDIVAKQRIARAEKAEKERDEARARVAELEQAQKTLMARAADNALKPCVDCFGRGTTRSGFAFRACIRCRGTGRHQ